MFRLSVLIALVIPSAALISSISRSAVSSRTSTRKAGYVPDGMTPQQYKAFKEKEQAEKNKKNLGMAGARGFQSRSLASFQKALENGEAKHLMPVNPAKVRRGEIALKDVPYMQRGGSWDNSDLASKKGWQRSGFGTMNAFNDGKAKKLKSNKYDKMYNERKPNTSILGIGTGKLPWSGVLEEEKAAPKEGLMKGGQRKFSWGF